MRLVLTKTFELNRFYKDPSIELESETEYDYLGWPGKKTTNETDWLQKVHFSCVTNSS